MQRCSLLAVFSTAVLASACSELDSEDVLTTGVSPDFKVESAGNGDSTVSARLHAGRSSLTYLQLTGDDNLTAKVGEETKDLTKTSGVDFNAPSYSADFAVDAAETEFTIAFVRTVDAGAPASTVKMPAPYEPTAPAEGAELSRENDDLVLTINEAAADPTTIQILGECIKSVDASIAAGETSVTIAKGTFVPPEDGESEEDPETKTCSVSVAFTRSRSGTLDPAFTEGGSITASQRRSLSLTLKP